MIRNALAGLAALTGLAAIAAPAAAGERLRLPIMQVSVVLPDGWDADIPPTKAIPARLKDHTFQDELHASCSATERCRRSLDTCTLSTYDDVLQLPDWLVKLTMFPKVADVERATERVLASTSVGATIAKPFGREMLGNHTWFTIESRAAYGWKSELYARTVVNGRYMLATCKTCATDDQRFDAARALLGSVEAG